MLSSRLRLVNSSGAGGRYTNRYEKSFRANERPLKKRSKSIKETWFVWRKRNLNVYCLVILPFWLNRSENGKKRRTRTINNRTPHTAYCMLYYTNVGTILY